MLLTTYQTLISSKLYPLEVASPLTLIKSDWKERAGCTTSCKLKNFLQATLNVHAMIFQGSWINTRKAGGDFIANTCRVSTAWRAS